MKKLVKCCHLEHIDNKEIYQLYKMCKVCALPSWLDTPGLVNLEAAAMGCNLAISSLGTTKEYFEDKACYCLPDDLDSIRNAVQTAYSQPRNWELSNIIFQKYTWAEAAKATLLGYRTIFK